MGQDNIVKVIESSVKLKRISHAYLFTGDRGTGKTSVARILASDIGCKEEDLYEIDAASNRGIDDIREIKQSVSALPFRSPYKVYIVDEVHMLTKDACNALLKTLEEPPAYIVFILATTEPEKLPETVISRCQVFNFKRPSQNILKEMVLNIARKENFTLEPASAELVALLSEGSFRDAQGILQKVINSSKDKKISLEEVELVTGAPKNELVNDFVKALAGKDVKGGLQAISVAAQQNLDMKVFLKLILQKVRFVLLIRLKAGLDKEIESEVRKEDFEFLKELSGQKGFNINSNTLYELLDTHDKIGRSYIPQLPLELVLVKLSQQEK